MSLIGLVTERQSRNSLEDVQNSCLKSKRLSVLLFTNSFFVTVLQILDLEIIFAINSVPFSKHFLCQQYVFIR